MNYLSGKNNMAMRSAVVGIGQELRGDDSLGIEIARRLKPLAEGHPAHCAALHPGASSWWTPP
jgi:Ni,Fe-hydrogenase maturation factor